MGVKELVARPNLRIRPEDVFDFHTDACTSFPHLLGAVPGQAPTQMLQQPHPVAGWVVDCRRGEAAFLAKVSRGLLAGRMRTQCAGGGTKGAHRKGSCVRRGP